MSDVLCLDPCANELSQLQPRNTLQHLCGLVEHAHRESEETTQLHPVWIIRTRTQLHMGVCEVNPTHTLKVIVYSVTEFKG